MNVITEKMLWLNSLQREEYEETKSTICMHDGISLKSYGSITLSILVGFRAVNKIFDVVSEYDFFRVKLGIPWINFMNKIASIIHKCLKFTHEGFVHVMHDIGY